MLINKLSKVAFVLSVFIGIVLGALGVYSLQLVGTQSTISNEPGADEPLYWVAPMDDNYRRSEPGKSPMGMDLVPVYPKPANGAEDGRGVVQITPQVINNLGVRTASVSREAMHTSITTVGYIQYDENNLVHIHPRVEGWVDTLYIKTEGDPVTKGESLYKLYSPQLVNAQEEFLIAIKRKNRSLVVAARARLAALHLSAEFIKNLESTKAVSQSVTFYAPQSGVVDGLKIREGFFVQPGTTIMSIGKLEQVWVEAEIFERDVAMVKSGLAVSMTIGYLPAKSWKGTVDYVYPSLDATTRTARVRLKFDNADLTLKPNMFAKVTIEANVVDKTIIVPKEAVIRTGKQDRVVLALGDGKFKSINVDIGRVDEDVIEILSGLTPEDTVVTSAHFLIDSESSKNSDFKRMEFTEHRHEQMDMSQTSSAIPSATVNGVIDKIVFDSRVLTISREAIEKWNRPPATMDFIVDEPLDMQWLRQGMEVTFTFEVRDDLFVVSIVPASKEVANNMHSEH